MMMADGKGDRVALLTEHRSQTGRPFGIPEAASHADEVHLPPRAEVSVHPLVISVDPASRSRRLQRATCIDREAPEAL
jgi:hypothetical protein